MATLSLTDPSGWRRWGSWLSLGMWNPDKGKQYDRPFSGPVSSNTHVSDERAMQVSAVFSCIRIISETCASLPLCVYERVPNGRKEVDGHWLSQLLEEPNKAMTGQEYREALVASIAGWGNGYTQVGRDSSGQPKQLWPLRPEGMEIDKTDRFSVSYKYRPTGDQGEALPLKSGETLMHVKGFGTDGIVGLSPLGIGREALGLAVSAEDYAGSFYANGGKPSGVLMLDRILTPDQRNKINKEFGGIASTTARDGNRLWVLEAAMKYQSISIAPEDAQMILTRQFQIGEIARLFRVPLFLLMEMEKSTSWGSGLEQQNLAFLAYTLRPYLRRIESSINRWLLTPAERKKYYVEHNVEGLLRTDSAARASFLSTMVQNGLMTRNEARAKENLPPMPGGDDLTVQMNLTPAKDLSKIQAPEGVF